MSDSRTAYIGLGANLGDRLATLREAARRLGDLGLVTGVSSLYETSPVGYTAQPAFLNAVIELKTALEATSLIKGLLGIEAQLGRTRSFPDAPRTLDLDLLILDDVVVEDDNAVVPHPRLQGRLFVLTPLAEVAPDVMHPNLGKTIRQLRAAIESNDSVVLVDGPQWVTLPASGAETIGDHSRNPASG